MTDQDRLTRLIEIWQQAAQDFIALARDLPEDQWGLPTDLEGWSVKDNVAHTAHLEAVLAGAPEETLEIEPGPHVKGLMGHYTEQGVLARRDRDMAALLEELEQSVATRSAELAATPPTDGKAAPARTFAGVPWDNNTLLSNRPLDVWMHEQDIRRASGRPGGFDSPAADHVIGVFARALPMVLGKRVGAGPDQGVLIDLGDRQFGAVMGAEGRAVAEVPDSPTVRISLSVEDYVVLAGGRRSADDVTASYDGDAALGRRILEALAVTP